MPSTTTVSSEGSAVQRSTGRPVVEVVPRWCHVFTLDGPVIITIDGPAGTGKSSVASQLARRLGLDFLDTGAMYRAAALISLEQGIEPLNLTELLEAVDRADIHFEWPGDRDQLPVITSRGRAIDRRIRNPGVDARVRVVSGIPVLRAYLVARQRRIAVDHPRLVSEGRDQGSVVFPNASVKFYLTAGAAVRAKRRAAQFRASGLEADEAAILEEINARDASDQQRQVGPLVCPSDAVVVDSSAMEFGRVIDEMERLVRERAERPH